MKKILKSDGGSFPKHEFIAAISQYLNQRTALLSSDLSRFCVCGGKRNGTRHNANLSADHAELIDFQQKQLEVSIFVHRPYYNISLHCFKRFFLKKVSGLYIEFSW